MEEEEEEEEEEVVAAAAAAAVVVELELELIQPHMAQKPVLQGEVGCACVAREVSVVVVVRGGKLAFGAHTFSTYSAQHKGQAFGAARVYWACCPRAAWGRHACVGRV